MADGGKRKGCRAKRKAGGGGDRAKGRLADLATRSRHLPGEREARTHTNYPRDGGIHKGRTGERRTNKLETEIFARQDCLVATVISLQFLNQASP